MKSPMTSSVVKSVPVPVTVVPFKVHSVVPVKAVGSGLLATLTSSPALLDVDAFVIVLYGLAAVPVPVVSSPVAHEQYTIAISYLRLRQAKQLCAEVEYDCVIGVECNLRFVVEEAD